MYRTGIMTLSDLGSKGQREDKSGPMIATMLAETKLYQVVKRSSCRMIWKRLKPP